MNVIVVEFCNPASTKTNLILNVCEFADKYIKMLKAGGTLRHKELLQPFGLYAGDPKFWQGGLDIISGFIDELEE